MFSYSYGIIGKPGLEGGGLNSGGFRRQGLWAFWGSWLALLKGSEYRLLANANMGIHSFL